MLPSKRKPINGKRLQRLRKEANLTQEQIAIKLGLTRETVCNIENNKPGTIDGIDQLIVELWWDECQAKLTEETQSSFIQYIVDRFTNRA